MQTTRPNEFIALVALLTALVAMSIDTMLPAVGQIATQLGATNPNDRQYIVLGFFAGMMVGTLIFGPISDSIGRKPTIYMGLVFYIAGALLCMVSTTFPMLIAGRLLQGFGAASPRIVSIAMVRDGAKGAEMARIMSFVMSVFMLVPILAPSIGQLVLYVASWRYIFTGFVVAAIAGFFWLALRQTETLTEAERLPFSIKELAHSAGLVIRIQWPWAIRLRWVLFLVHSQLTLEPRSRFLPNNICKVIISLCGLVALQSLSHWP